MRKVVFLLSIFILFLLCSCTVTQSFDFTSSKSLAGFSESTIKTDEFFNRVMEDLSTWTEDQGNITDSAVVGFEQQLIKTRKTSFVEFTKEEDSWNGTFCFSSFEDLINSLSTVPDQNIVKVEISEDSTFLNLRIGMDNYETLTKIIPFLADPNLEVYGPMYNNYMEEEDYLEMIAFILGEDGPDSIRNSNITIRVSTPKAIKSTNAKKVNSNTVEFTFPLIKFLLLKEDICFYCEF